MSSFLKNSRTWILGAGLIATATLTGCQVEIGGQTLPSPYYIYDDVQYFPAGPEFILSNEAAAMQAQNDAQAAQPGPLQAQRPGYTPVVR